MENCRILEFLQTVSHPFSGSSFYQTWRDTGPMLVPKLCPFIFSPSLHTRTHPSTVSVLLCHPKDVAAEAPAAEVQATSSFSDLPSQPPSPQVVLQAPHPWWSLSFKALRGEGAGPLVLHTCPQKLPLGGLQDTSGKMPALPTFLPGSFTSFLLQFSHKVVLLFPLFILSLTKWNLSCVISVCI